MTLKMKRLCVSVLCALLAVFILAVDLKPWQAHEVSANSQSAQDELDAPKYIFMFIGDGMSYPQFQTASDYLGVVNQPEQVILSGGKKLSFMEFPVVGTATTFDSTSFAPDSASTATSMSTGYKTYSGIINMDESKTITYETITEKLSRQKDYKIGIVTSVNLNHATPAAYYAHQPARSNYYEIGEELVASGFDYFAGGALLSPTGVDEDRQDFYELAQEAGYTVIKTQAGAQAVNQETGKVIIIGEKLADSDALSYDNDRSAGEWALKDYVKKGIEVLDNENGFFMMVEGGKIDWACHANDAASSIADTLALADAVSEAVAFYNSHPDETLIIVTGDHETGGLTIGYAGTDYDTYLQNLKNQKISYAKFDSDYVADYIENNTDFEQVKKDVTAQFGLIMPGEGNEENPLVLTEYELGLLEKAYERTKADQTDDLSQEEYILYGSYEPLTVTITHLLNQKSGIGFTSYAHTGLPVAVFAQGVGAHLFEGYYDNTDIYMKIAGLTGVR